MQHEGRTREEAAGDMPALAAFDDGLVPGDRAGEGLVAVDQQAGGAVGRARRGDGDAVGALGHGIGRQVVEALQLGVEAVEEGGLEDEAGGDVLARDGEHARRDLIGMLGAVEVDAVGVALQHGADVGRQLAFITGVDRLPDAQQADDVVGRRRLQSVRGGQMAPGGQGDLLDGGEVVLGVGEGQAEGGVGVGLAEDVGHAPVVAADLDVVAVGAGDQGVVVDLGRLVRQIEQQQRPRRQNHEPDEADQAPDDPTHAHPPNFPTA